MELNVNQYDFIDIKCGEVFLNANGNLILVCTLCDIKYKEFQEYTDHTMEKHFLFDVLDEVEEPSAADDFLSEPSVDESSTFSTTDEVAAGFETIEDGCQIIEEIEILEPNQDIKEETNSLETDQIVEDYKDMIYVDANELIEELEETTDSAKPVKSVEKLIYTKAERSENLDAITLLEFIYNCGTYPPVSGKRYNYCWECDKSFSSKSGYRTHARIHTGEKKYRCSRADCRESFVTSYSYRKHMQECMQKFEMISQSRTFSCTKCKARMKTAKNLELHMKSHNERQQMICQLCSSCFDNQNDLVDHLRSKHSEAAQVKVCIKQL